MEAAVTTCPCGADALKIGPSTKREEARERYEAKVAMLESSGSLMTGTDLRERGRAILALQVLAADAYEVLCGNCGRWVHDDSEEHAVNTWNRALAKLDHLQPCCRESSEHRFDFDGMALNVCTSPDHDTTINGARWLPLDPDASYDVKPSDAEVKK